MPIFSHKLNAMKRYFYFAYILMVTILLLFNSCSNNDNNDPPIVIDEEKLALATDKLELNVLEVTSIRPKGYSGIFALFDRFDSIRWGIPGTNEERYIAKQNSLTGNISVGFCLPGIYNAVISGYKDGKIAQSDTLIFKCYIDGDFLSIKWNDNKKPGTYCIGGHNNVTENYQLTLIHIKGENPYAQLEYKVGSFPRPDPNADPIKQRTESRKLFDDYITKLYGNPTYSYEGDDFVHTPYLSEYDKRFTVALDGLGLGITYAPVTIWDTDKSHIVLLGAVDNKKQESYPYYTVIAEPRKF